MPLSRALLLLGLASLLAPTSRAAAPTSKLDWDKNGAPAWATPADIKAAACYRTLGMDINSRDETTDGVFWKYEAMAQIVRAAGIQVQSRLDPQEKDTVRAMWNRFEEKGLLVCNSLQFDVMNGSPLKYAALSNFDAFIRFAADLKIGLTRVDESDGRTILDYLKYKIERSPGSALNAQYRSYYKVLKEAGAKHRAELP